MLGISSEVKSSQIKTFKPKFRLAYLKSTKVEQIEIKKGIKKGTTQPVLSFEFREKEDSERTYIHRFFPLDVKVADRDTPAEVEKYQKSHDTQAGNIKHLMECYIETSFDQAVGDKLANCETYEEFYNKVADWFNGVERDAKGKPKGEAKPVFKTSEGKPIIVWVKMVYPRKGSNIGFPYTFNFIEKVREGKDHNLTWNPLYDFEEIQSADTATAGGIKGQGLPGDDDLPDGWGD